MNFFFDGSDDGFLLFVFLLFFLGFILLFLIRDIWELLESMTH